MSNVLAQALEDVFNVANNLGEFAGAMTTQVKADALTKYASTLFSTAAALKEAIKQQGEPVVWMQSDHLDKFKHNACGSDSMLARCSIRQLQPDYRPLYTSAQTMPEGWKKATHANAPKYGTRVIVLTTDADGDPVHELAHYNGEKIGYLGVGGKRIKPVTYWMPLSAAPKGK